MVRQLGSISVSFLIFLGVQMAHGGNGPYDLDGRFGFGVGGGIHSSVGGEVLKDAGEENMALSAWFRYHMTSAWSLDLAYDSFSYDEVQNFSSKLKNNHINLSVGYRAWATERSRLLMQFGLGLLNSGSIPHLATNTSQTRKTLGMKLRLAYEYMLARDWSFNLSADYHYAKIDKDSVYDINDFQIISPMAGITYYFGSGASAPADSDGDGVSDDMDKCPGSASGGTVGADGCAVKKAVAIVDGDYDGVADSDDKCPGTKMGMTVNAYGCAATEKLEFKLDVKFASGKSSVPATAEGSLAEFAAFMQKNSSTKAEIAGHTDSTGKESFNNMISQKRADAVRNYLIQKFGISADRLTAKGYGPSQPIGDNGTASGRRSNRRVVATVQN